MTVVQVDLLRLVLPPFHAVESVPVRCAWRDSTQHWNSAELDGGVAAVGARFKPKRLEICPHPVDVSMIEADLPPLPSKRMRAGVNGAVELLSLVPPNELSIGFGTRGDTGKVSVAWTAAEGLSHAIQLLGQQGLRVDAVYPPPAFLPEPEPEEQDGSTNAVIIDDWMVLRTGNANGALHPVPTSGAKPEISEDRLRKIMPEIGVVRWSAESGQDETVWSGSGWSWTLPQGQSASRSNQPGWVRPALGWGAAAVLVWVVGLNIYAGRVEADGMALKRQMADQVKAAFPELSVVLNPLQQARQLRDARQSGNATVVASDFPTLLRATAALLPESTGQVLRLDYRDGQLELRWRDGAALKASEVDALQGQAQERGLAVDSDAGSVRIRAAEAPDGAGEPAS